MTDPVNRDRHAMVMEVPAGANLRFDRPLDLKHGGGLGRLIEGQLRGQVTIRRLGKRPDHRTTSSLGRTTWRSPSSGLRLPTRSTSPTAQAGAAGVSWRSSSCGGLDREPRTKRGRNVGGIEQFQVEHVERMHLEMGPEEGAGSRERGAGRSSPLLLAPCSSRPPSGPVEITCQGPFRFHLVDQVATFRDQVVVVRERPDGARRPHDVRRAFGLLRPTAAFG